MQSEREAKREAAREATQEAKREAEREAKREAESTLDLIFKFVFACFPYPSRAGLQATASAADPLISGFIEFRRSLLL